MKQIFKFNLILYLAVVALYIYETMLGAMGQFILGLIQIIIAIKLSLEIDFITHNTKKYLKYYWLIVLIWLCILISLIITSEIQIYRITFIFVIPMILGLYFIVTIYILKKES